MAEPIISLDVVNFKQEIQRIQKEAEEIAKEGVGEQAKYATEQLRVVTPVDTGEARSGWRLEDERNAFLIINDVEHIVYLNNGHSQQAPKYFIEQVLSTIGLITPN